MNNKVTSEATSEVILQDTTTGYITPVELKGLTEKYGVRYVIRNFKLSDNAIKEIMSNKYSTINEENDIEYREIISYQKCLK